MGIPLTDYENPKYIGQYNPHDHRQTGGLNTAQFMSKQMPNKNKSKPSTTRQKTKFLQDYPQMTSFEEVSDCLSPQTSTTRHPTYPPSTKRRSPGTPT